MKKRNLKIKKIPLPANTLNVKGGDPTGWNCHRVFAMCGPEGCITLCYEY